MKTSLAAIFIFLFGFNLQAQFDFEVISPKREFRGIWVATVQNIDYPKRPTPLTIPLKEQWKNLLDSYKKWGMNAVIVQVRPAGDAFYPSEIVPWSKFLTGRQGTAPDQDFDPLAFMIEETHKRSMEFHAWFNPYRATTNMDTLSLSENHQFYRNRSWMLRYGDRFYFNPALRQVQEHLTNVVGEVVEKYNIDAVHFDDYFYPYKIKDLPFPDSTDYVRYGRGFKTIEDWRRSNVDALIQQISERIRAAKGHVKFGISPFGVWRNKEDDQMGSETRAGATCYDDLYADVLKWVRMGWIDYVAPQIYWHIGFEPADHETLINWWSLHAQAAQLYIGHAAYKVANNPERAWSDPEEMPRQIMMNRRNPVTQGSIYFSSRSIVRNAIGLRDSIRSYYKKPAILPESTEFETRPHKAPKLSRVRSKKGAVKLKWCPNKEDKKNPPAYYAIYRFEGTDVGDMEDGNNLLALTPFFEKKRRFKFIDETAKVDEYYTYVITAVNRQHVESRNSQARRILKLEKRVKRVKY